MAKLFFRYSSMGAGKTLDLLRSNYNYNENNKKTLCLISGKDNRYGKDKITSRIGISTNAISIYDETNIFELVKDKIDISCIFVDEIQFLTKEHIIQLSDIVDKLNIPVICYGLRSDFQMNPFLSSSYLMAICDEIQEIKSICWCGKKAIINARIVNGQISEQGDQILVGDKNYISLCRKHFKEKNLGKNIL